MSTIARLARPVSAAVFSLVVCLWSTAAWSAAPAAAAPPDIKKVCGAAPQGSISLNGKKATKAQMDNVKQDVIAFMAVSDIYQDCINKYLAHFQAQLSPDEVKRVLALKQENQKEKEDVGNGYNAAVDDFAKAHPGHG